MKLLCFTLLLSTFFTPIICLSESQGSFGYEDAETPSEAVGMIKSTILASQVMIGECKSRYPSGSEEFDNNLHKWQTQESENIKKAEYHWSVMESMDAKLLEMPTQISDVIKGQLELLEKFRKDDSEEFLKEHCQNYFANLASGIWRLRTPKAYDYMDKTPSQ